MVVQTLNFSPNVDSLTVSVPLCPDLFLEPDESVNLALSAPTGATLGGQSTATLTVNDTANQFRNTDSISITAGNMTLPSPITVTGGPTNVFRIRVTFYDVSHTRPDDIDALIVGPNGARYVLQGSVGGITPIDPNAPVTLTFFDSSPNVLPDNGPLVRGSFLPTTCQTPVTSFPAPAPGGPYVEPGCTIARAANQTMYGNFGLIDGNGTWTLYVRDRTGSRNPDNIVGEFAGGWGLELLAATSSGVSVSGRVTTANGQGIRNARITVTGNSVTEPIQITTGAFGNYNVDGLRAGETYVITVGSTRYSFAVPSRVLNLVDNVADLDFVSIE